MRAVSSSRTQFLKIVRFRIQNCVNVKYLLNLINVLYNNYCYINDNKIVSVIIRKKKLYSYKFIIESKINLVDR